MLPAEAVALAEPAYFGPDAVELELLRPGKDPIERSRIYVQAKFHDGSSGVFLVDTGAAISVLNPETAERLKMDLERGGIAQGLGGSSRYDVGVMPVLGLGDAALPEVAFAVGVDGAPKMAGLMEIDGILGNNVWSRFLVEIDYPADTLVLHRPGTVRTPKRATHMLYNGSHLMIPIEVETDTEPRAAGQLFVMVDTGASELMLQGPDAVPLDLQPNGIPLWSEDWSRSSASARRTSCRRTCSCAPPDASRCARCTSAACACALVSTPPGSTTRATAAARPTSPASPVTSCSPTTWRGSTTGTASSR
jgi:hypothetical protein